MTEDAADVAHDLTNLLTVVLSYAGFVDTKLARAVDAERWDSARSDLDRIRTAARQAADLIAGRDTDVDDRDAHRLVRAGAPAAGPAIRVLLVDDHQILLDSLVRLFADEPAITVIGTAATAGTALAIARAERPDVVVIDFHLPDADGAEATRQIRRELPGHPERGLVAPGEFLPLAEDTGFIIDIGRWVVEEATRQLARWQARFPSDPRRWMTINLSASGLSRPETVDTVGAAVAAAGIDPGDLVVETTETTVLEDTSEVLERMKALAELGVHLALDDFGTAFSSLAYLRRFPFDTIKIDTSFTAELPHGTRSVQLAEAVLHLATSLGMLGVAEGIERREQADTLLALGWELGQGYFFSRPVDEAEMDRMLEVGVAG